MAEHIQDKLTNIFSKRHSLAKNVVGISDGVTKCYKLGCFTAG
jgi:hypothetical protein